MTGKLSKALCMALVAIPCFTILSIVGFIASVITRSTINFVIPFGSYTSLMAFFMSFAGNDTGFHHLIGFILSMALFILSAWAAHHQKAILPAAMLVYFAFDICGILDFITTSSNLVTVERLSAAIVFNICVMALIVIYLVAGLLSKRKPLSGNLLEQSAGEGTET